MAIQAVVVEGEPFVLEALCDFLEGCGVDVTARAPDAAAAIRTMAETLPDIVLVGSAAVGQDEREAARMITDAFPAVPVITLSTPGHPVIVGLPSPESSVVQLDCHPGEFIETVRRAGTKAQYRLTWS